MKKLLFFAFALLLGNSGILAQKYGHLNLGNLIAEMPETGAADSEMEIYQKGLVAKGEEMASKFQQDYEQFIADAQSGNLAPVQQQERQEALQKKQQEIQQYEQEIRQKMQNKRQELLEPIIKKAEAAIKEVAQENGFTMIFDTSTFNTVLYTVESDDVMALVKAKLGL